MDKCKHPEDQREPYHDMTVICCACNCVIEQFGKPIDPPSPLSPKIWPVESSREPTCSTALIIEAGDYELQDDSPDVIWLYHRTGEGLAIPRDEFADILDALFKQRF